MSAMPSIDDYNNHLTEANDYDVSAYADSSGNGGYYSTGSSGDEGDHCNSGSNGNGGGHCTTQRRRRALQQRQ